MGAPSLLALSTLLCWFAAHGGSSTFFPSEESGASSQSHRRERLERTPRAEEGGSPVCAYRVVEGGIWGQLCFRRTLFGYRCAPEDCRSAVSLGSLVANILVNGSVLFQWGREGASNATGRRVAPQQGAAARQAGADSAPLRAGWELSCWWNGSYTQFECAGVRLGSGCRDLLLSELHENVPYRFCLRSAARSRHDCVEFTVPPSGMQDIVIAMTTVGGAICVMLVIICLLVAYITENLMSPTAQQAYSYRAHPRH